MLTSELKPPSSGIRHRSRTIEELDEELLTILIVGVRLLVVSSPSKVPGSQLPAESS